MTVEPDITKFRKKTHMKNAGQLLGLTIVKTKTKERKKLSKLARNHPATHNPVMCKNLGCCLLECNHNYRSKDPRGW